MPDTLADIGYLVSAIFFILGLKGLTHPRTAPRGNLLSALGMLIAVGVVLITETNLQWPVIAAGMLIGSAIGVALAATIQMTAMPQLVALFNGFGGGASLLVALLALTPGRPSPAAAIELQTVVASVCAALIGTVTFSGSLVAYGKLQGLLRRPLVFAGQQAVNIVIAVVMTGAGVMVVAMPQQTAALWVLVGLALVLGVLLVMPIGGADMPVVIAILNAYSGLAACGAGFILSNTVLIISGSLVGASGIILTRIMCRAMNRSFQNVIFGMPLGQTQDTPEDDIYEGRIKSTSADEIAMLLETARHVVIVPGYGMAVSQAQHAVRDMTHLLEARGASVVFAIHPVAGRMPGHMNVLLAEADIPYEQLKEMDDVNPTFDQTDVAIVIGANDVINPQARNAADSPIAGMPILDVDRAKTVVVIKRSLSPGFAGIANPLFAADQTLMFFADAKQGISEINTALKEL